MESLALLLFSSYPFDLITYFSLYSIYNNSIFNFDDENLIMVKWDDGYLIYRNDRIASLLNFSSFKFVLGDFISIIGFGFLSGYSSNSMSIQYFNLPKLNITFYLSPSESYKTLISRGFYIQNYFLNNRSLSFAYLYDSISESHSIILNFDIANFSILTLYKHYLNDHLIKVGEFYFYNDSEFYFGTSYFIENLLNLGYETRIYFIDKSLYFINYFLFINLFKIISFRVIHKEVYSSAQYYFSNGEFYQFIINIEPIFFGFYYQKKIYNNNQESINYEFYIEDLQFIKNKIYLSLYFSVPYIYDLKESPEVNYSFALRIKNFENFFSILYLSNNLASFKLDMKNIENQRFIFQLFYNLNRYGSTSFSLPQVSIYDSFDFYIPVAAYGTGIYYFILLKNISIAFKVIFTLSDNQIGKSYIYFGLFSSV